MKDFRLVIDLSDCETYIFTAESLGEAYCALPTCLKRFKSFYWRIETQQMSLCPLVVACGAYGKAVELLAKSK